MPRGIVVGVTERDWLAEVAQLDREMDQLRDQLAQLADDRASIIAGAVVRAGRGNRAKGSGGRGAVAEALGVTVGQIDVAIRRAKSGRMGR